MSRQVVILGVSMTRVGKFLEKSLKDLTREAVESVLKDAGIEKKQIQSAYMENVQAGAVSRQILIKGQVWLRAAGIGDIPVVNTNNVCATGIAQVTELVWHLRGQAGERQVKKSANTGFAQIYGGT